ncbi:PQQ-binding-like beta-propeller repeat protein [Natronobeatus ordinarius]|uniref:outer membrane protein assembly factor BamB family protein n=1 Tax=Natronobeatus ordinarius TaxID=2963433 RepID=UPI0020CC67E7|nr:PQQ-binding-like beta-propeller repeat protein [Natronobeatus ordinarius]
MRESDERDDRTRTHPESAPDIDPLVTSKEGSVRERAKDVSRRTVLRASAGVGVAAVGLGAVASTPVSATSAGDVIWTYGEDLDCSQASTFGAPLTVVDGWVYAGTTCAHMHVLEAATGNQVKTIYTNATTNRAPNVVNDIAVFAPNNHELKAYDHQEEEARTKRIWETDVGGTATTRVSAPTVFDGTVYVTNHDGPPYCYALELFTGEERWTYDEHELGEAPVVDDGVVYATGRDGVLVALEADTGDVRWSFDVGASVESAPTVADGRVFVASTDGTLFAVDGGDEEWRFEADGEIQSTPTVADGTVYVGSFDGHLYAVDATDGDELWRFETDEITNSATVVDGTVFLTSQGGWLYSVDASTGEANWEFQETELNDDLYPNANDPIVVDGVVYVATTDGRQGRVRALDAGVSGSSEDSRILLGTTGHHDAWSQTAAVDGRPADGESMGTSGDDGSSQTDGDGETGGDDDGLPGFGLLGAVASLAGVSYLLGRRGDGPEMER